MMINNKAIAYAEVYEILSYMDKATVMKIPIELLNMIKENRDKTYKTKIDKNDIFNNKNISQLSLSIIAYLDLNYWATEEEKKVLLEKYKENGRLVEIEKQKKYGKDIFENIHQVKDSCILVPKRETLLDKIKSFLKKIFLK